MVSVHGAVHQKLHSNLRAQGIPCRGRNYTGTLDEFYDIAERAYDGINDMGYAIGPNGQMIDNVTPQKTLDIMKSQNKKSKAITC